MGDLGDALSKPPNELIDFDRGESEIVTRAAKSPMGESDPRELG